MRWKLFKRYLSLSKDTRDIYKPQRNAECDETVRLILMRRKQKQQ
jgi:hypothetical protein